MARRQPRRATKAKASDRATAYARAVVSGKIVAGAPVRLACKRHLTDLRAGKARGLEWRVAAAEKAIDFFSEVLVLESGEPFDLHPFQCFIVGSLFGWYGPDGFRRFRTAFCELGKGSGKSPTAAGIGHLGFVADNEPAPEIYVAATMREQAKIVFTDAVRMVEASPELKDLVSVQVGSLSIPSKHAVYRPVSAEHRGLDGLRVHMGLIDELHEHPSALVVDKIRAGTKARRNALLFEITNSGWDRNSVCWNHHEYSLKVLEGVIENDSWFAYVCALDGPREETYQSDLAVRQLAVGLCSCEQVTATVIESIGREVCARAATTSGSEKTRQGTRHVSTQRRSPGNSATQSGGRSIAGSGLVGARGTGHPRPESSVSDALDCLLSHLNGLPRVRIGTALSAPSRNRSSSTTITAQGDSGDFSAQSVTDRLAYSEILRRVYDAHSSTCAARTAKLNGHSITVSVPGDDWRDEKVWVKTNPGLEYGLPPIKYLREQVAEAVGMPTKENLTRRLNFCEWTEQSERAIPMVEWDKPEACAPIDIEALRGRECYGGLDLAKVGDLSAFTLLFPPLTAGELWKVLCRFWVPEDDITRRAQRDHVPYDVWQRQGHITATPGNTTDYGFIEAEIVELAGAYSIREVAFDRTFAGEIVQALMAEGLQMVQFGQGFLSMASPTAELLRMVKAGELQHGGNPVLRWNASNLSVSMDAAGNMKPDRERSAEKIDGISALCNALGRAAVRRVVSAEQNYRVEWI